MMITNQVVLKAFEKKAILVVDDEKFSRTLIRQVLYPLNVMEASNGQQARMFLSQNPQIDLIICDFNMPVMDGLNFLKSVRSGQESVRHSTPVLMVTGSSDSSLVKASLQLDIDGFIIKPITQKTLEQRLLHIETTNNEIRDTAYYKMIDIKPVTKKLLPQEQVKKQEVPSVSTDDIEVDIADIPMDAMLSRDIMREDELLLASGQILSARLIKRITELNAIGIIPQKIWIKN